MERLNLPAYPFRIKNDGKKTQIFDSVRKKFVTLTPEEWVRQHFINYLVTEKKVPASLIAVEMGLKYNTLRKRSDIVIYDNAGSPVLIVECKTPDVKITQDTFDQAARYNMALKVKYIVVTNGLTHYFCQIDHKNRSYFFLKDLPPYTAF
ncbi:MAG: type I restriction enzyme HsdR N-terminal domain-containing protein [Bacteroidota bacterium]